MYGHRVATLALVTAGMIAGCGSKGPADVDQLTLPGNNYYPESMNISQDGTIFVGSLGTGQVVKFAPGSTTASVLVPTGTVKAVAGVLVDDARSLLWLCANDLMMMTPSMLRSFDLADGTPKGSYAGPAFCNDMAFDGQHNLYVTDSAGKVYRLADGASDLQVWSSDPQLAPSSPMGFGADGIVWDGQGSLYVNTFSDSRLLRLPINQDGSAGAAVAINVTPALNSPDGMRLLDATTLVLVEGVGHLTRVNVSGTTATATVLKDGLNGPTSLGKFGAYYWVSEGQLGHLLGLLAGPPSLPFTVRRIAAN